MLSRLTGLFHQMVCLSKDPAEEKIFVKISTDFDCNVNAIRTTISKDDHQQRQNSLSLSTLSFDDREKKELKESIQGKERVIIYLRSALDALS